MAESWEDGVVAGAGAFAPLVNGVRTLCAVMVMGLRKSEAQNLNFEKKSWAIC